MSLAAARRTGAGSGPKTPSSVRVPEAQLAKRKPGLRGYLTFTLAALLVAALIAASLFTGVYDLNGGDIGAQMLWITRVPRTVALVLTGSAMAVSGLLMQMITQNRFVEPTTTGTAEWAGLGLLVSAIVLPSAGLATKMVVATTFALVGTCIFLVILQRIRIRNSLVVPLVGIMLGAVISAFTTYIAVTTNLLQMISTWFQGSFTGIVRGRYEMLWVVAAVVVLVYFAADRFTVAGLGQDMATSMGIDYKRTVFIGASLAALATGVTTVVVGFVPFLGLVVPNLVSMARGDNLRSNLPWVCLGGIALIIGADLIGRTIIMPFEVPVSLVLGVVGATVFIAMLVRQMNRG